MRVSFGGIKKAHTAFCIPRDTIEDLNQPFFFFKDTNEGYRLAKEKKCPMRVSFGGKGH